MKTIKYTKIIVFTLVILLFMGVAVANDVNNTQNINNNDIEKNTINCINPMKDINNNINKISTSKTIKTSNTSSQSIQSTNSLQSTKTKIIHVNPKYNLSNSDGSKNQPYNTIQEAVNKAAKQYNNIIYLSPGNHVVDTPIQITRTVAIIGKSKEETNITCNFNQGFRISKNCNLTLKNVRVQNAKYTQGGVILANDNTKVTINNCTFKKNRANNGAVIFGSGNNIRAKITDSNFLSNTDVRFGALHLGGYNSVYNINNCIFIKNILTDRNYSHSTGGAAIYASSYAQVNINNSVFKNNMALWGNAILNGNHANINITYCNFTSNIAEKNIVGTNRTKGGAIAVGSGYAEIGNCRFIKNQADVGGAITINSGETTLIYSSIFQKNIAYTQAGAINNYGSLTVKDSIFLKNNGTRRGGAILDIGNSEITIENCTFKNNRVITSYIPGSVSSVPQGGAISISGACHMFTIRKSIFDHNSAYFGGAIYSVRDTLWITISDCTFKNNTAYYGGAMVVAGETTLDINTNTFNYNRALKKGGALLINGSAQGKFSFTLFKANQAKHTKDGYGGAICVLCYAKLYFNACKFDGNTAKYNGGAFYIASSATINIMKSNLTRNVAVRGSVIYLNNSKTYNTQRCKVYIETSTLLKNSQYVLYSLKAFNNTYANNYVTTSWWGSNVLPKHAAHNFKIKNYYIATVNLDDNIIDRTWTKDRITITLNRTKNIEKTLILSLYSIKEGNTIRYTDAFLPAKTFTIKENNGKETTKNLYVYYHLNMNLDKIEITLDNQKITLKIVD